MEEERPRHPVPMYTCVCLTVGVCKLEYTFTIKRDLSFEKYALYIYTIYECYLHVLTCYFHLIGN